MLLKFEARTQAHLEHKNARNLVTKSFKTLWPLQHSNSAPPAPGYGPNPGVGVFVSAAYTAVLNLVRPYLGARYRFSLRGAQGTYLPCELGGCYSIYSGSRTLMMITIIDTLYFKGGSNRYGMPPRSLVRIRTRGIYGHSQRTIGCGPARERGGGRGPSRGGRHT
jgi:hypothetical protein